MTVLVTAWERRQKDLDTGEYYWEHNHIEDGWVYGFTPVGKFKVQDLDWKNGVWRKEWCFMIDPPRNRVLTREAYVRRYLGKMY